MPRTSKQKGKKKQGNKSANQFHKNMGKSVTKSSEAQLSPEADALLSELFNTIQPSSETKSKMDRLLTLAGHDLSIDANDPYGDGDQSGIGRIGDNASDESKRQIIRTLFAQGGDTLNYLAFDELTPFAKYCAVGNATMVEQMIQETPAFSEDRKQLLERRESGMRFSPLLLTFYFFRAIGNVSMITQVDVKDMRHIDTIKVLLKYGARPDAKEVTGKTISHYTAGAMATDETMLINDYCVEDMKTSHYYGKTVILRKISKDEFNGLQGRLAGFMADKGRCLVTLENGKGTLSVKPQNIFSKSSDNDSEECIYDPSRKLVDIPDRLGSTSILEVYMSENVDVCRYLTDKHSAAIDIEDRSGMSVRALAWTINPGAFVGGLPEMTRVIRNYQMKQSKGQSNNSTPSMDHSVLLETPRDNNHMMMGINGSTYSGGSESYRKPNTVDVGELFWIKVQCGPAPTMPLLVYDKTRTCSFQIDPGTSGFMEIFQKVRAEMGANGRKTHFMASFDSNGDCRVFPDTAELKSW